MYDVRYLKVTRVNDNMIHYLTRYWNWLRLAAKWRITKRQCVCRVVSQKGHNYTICIIYILMVVLFKMRKKKVLHRYIVTQKTSFYVWYYYTRLRVQVHMYVELNEFIMHKYVLKSQIGKPRGNTEGAGGPSWIKVNQRRRLPTNTERPPQLLPRTMPMRHLICRTKKPKKKKPKKKSSPIRESYEFWRKEKRKENQIKKKKKISLLGLICT